MVPKRLKKSKISASIHKAEFSKSPNCVQKASPPEDESTSTEQASSATYHNKAGSSTNTQSMSLKSTLKEVSELSSEPNSSQQTPGGISLPVVLPTVNSDSEIDLDNEDEDEEKNYEYGPRNDDEDEDEDDEEFARIKVEFRDRTRKSVRDFLDSSKHKPLVDMNISRLAGKKDYPPWLFAVEIQLRLHLVWEVVSNELMPLASTDGMYSDYMRMNDVGCAVIFANISQQVRECPCVYAALRRRDPGIMMNAINEHFGPKSEDNGGHCH